MPTAKTKVVQSFLAAVDVYIHKAAPFAQPVLERIRESIHEAVPEVVEEMKWSMPFFIYRGIILANMAAFKAHCSFGLWKENVKPLLKAGVEERGGGMGSFGKLKSLEDMPAAKDLKKMLVTAAAKIDSGERSKNWERRVVKKAPLTHADIPQPLAAALKSNKAATLNFKNLSASCRREYIDWIHEAKRDETRDKRIATTIAWVAKGKSRNWKYAKRA
jgi:hypothetical protein